MRILRAVADRSTTCSVQDDPFFNEISTFVDASEDRELTRTILSSYDDAVKTYEFVSVFVTTQCRPYTEVLRRLGRFGERVRGPQKSDPGNARMLSSRMVQLLRIHLLLVYIQTNTLHPTYTLVLVCTRITSSFCLPVQSRAHRSHHAAFQGVVA